MLLWEKEYLRLLKKVTLLFYLLLFVVALFLGYRFFLSGYLFHSNKRTKQTKERLYTRQEASQIITHFDTSFFQDDKFRFLKEKSYQKVVPTAYGRDNPFIPFKPENSNEK